MRARFPLAVALAAMFTVTATACAPARPDTELSFRLWDPHVAEAYRASFDAFEDRTGTHVEIVVVPWEDYWSQLRADIASGTVDDLFWTNATNVTEYARAGAITAVSAAQIEDQAADWAPSVVSQFTIDGELWGIPQLTDPGIGLLVNTDLLTAAGHSSADLSALSWDPRSADDSLRALARDLTYDAEGRHPRDAGFDPHRVIQYGYGASSDLNAMLLPFLGSNAAAWQDGDEFVFAHSAGREAIGYLIRLIAEEKVAPPAADTLPPAGADAVRELFVSGRLALFQTGAYSLAHVDEFADFSWTIAPIPAGPRGRVSPTNGIIAAASSATSLPSAQAQLLEWLGSTEGSQAIGESGATLPAVLSAQEPYREVWERRGVDVSPMFDVLENGWIQPPQGLAYSAASDALLPALNEVFLGIRPLDDGLKRAQSSANDAISRVP